MPDTNENKRTQWDDVYDWWESMRDNRRACAELRRAASPLEALFVPQGIGLANRLLPKEHKDYELQRLGAVAGVLAHVRRDNDVHPAVAMALPREGGASAPVSEARFRRLLACEELDELYPMLIRVLRILDNQADVKQLAKSICYWKSGNGRERRNWAFEYFSNAPKS